MVRVVDAQTDRALGGATVSWWRDDRQTQLIESQLTSRAPDGRVEFRSADVIYQISVELEDYMTVRRRIDRVLVCGRGVSRCEGQIAIARQLRDGDLAVEADGCWLYTKDKGTFEMQATLEWNDVLTDGGEVRVDLDLWARYYDCGYDVEQRAMCERGSTVVEEAVPWTSATCRRDQFTNAAVLESEARACPINVGERDGRVLLVSEDGVPQLGPLFANQLPKWVMWESRVGSMLTSRLKDSNSIPDAPMERQPEVWIPDEFEGWPQDSFMMLDVDQNRLGPETVTFKNPPFGLYQVAVNEFSRPRRGVAASTPTVRLTLGANGVFECKIPPSCDAGLGTIWSVADIDIGQEVFEPSSPRAGGAPMFKYRVTILENPGMVIPIERATQPTTGRRNNLNTNPIQRPFLQYFTFAPAQLTQEELDAACVGQCEPAAGDLSDSLRKCIHRHAAGLASVAGAKASAG